MNWRTTRPGRGWIEGLAGKDDVKGGQERLVPVEEVGAQRLRVIGERGVTVGTDSRAMLHHVVWHGHQVQCLARVAQLSTWLLPALLAQALGLALEAVTAGGIAAVVAILGEACLQVVQTCQQRKVLLAQALILGFELGKPATGAVCSVMSGAGGL